MTQIRQLPDGRFQVIAYTQGAWGGHSVSAVLIADTEDEAHKIEADMGSRRSQYSDELLAGRAANASHEKENGD